MAKRNVLGLKKNKNQTILLLSYIAFVIQIDSQDFFRDKADRKLCSTGCIESSVPCLWQHAMSLFDNETLAPEHHFIRVL